MKNIINILKNNDLLKITLAFLLTFILLTLFSKLDNSYIKESKLFISEILPKNTYTIKDNYGEYSDYIEIYNGFSNSVNLSGYHLSDNEFETNKWTFPDITIKPNEYLIVYASGKNICDKEKNICHTSFKLSSKGEVITLSDSNGNIINKFSYSSVSNDLAYGFINNKYTLLSKPSPGKENDSEFKYLGITNNDLYINEYMTNNKRSSYDPSGYYNDYVEIYNNSDSDIDVGNIFLTDDEDNLTKYKLPNIVLKKKEYLLVYLSDKSMIIDNQIIANFKLSESDKYIIISNGKKIIEKIELVKLIDNVSYGKDNDKWYYYTKPTPGKENSTKGIEKLDDKEK